MKNVSKVLLALLLAWAAKLMDLDELASIVLQHDGGAGNHQPQQPARAIRGARGRRGRGGGRGAGVGLGGLRPGQGRVAGPEQRGRQGQRGRGLGHAEVGVALIVVEIFRRNDAGLCLEGTNKSGAPIADCKL